MKFIFNHISIVCTFRKILLQHEIANFKHDYRLAVFHDDLPIISVAILFATIGLSISAVTVQATNVVGTWVGVTHAAILGVDPHHNTKDPNKIRFVKTEFTFVIDKQEGQNFSGYRISKNGLKDNFVGAFRSNMKSGVTSNSDGTRVFDMVGNDIMDSCYTHTISANGKSTVAACNELKRQ